MMTTTTTTTTTVHRHTPTRPRRRVLHAVRVAVTYLFVIWCIAPVLWLVTTSLKSNSQAFANPPVFFFTPRLDAYAAAWTSGGMGHALMMSAAVSVISAVVGILAGMPLAYLITQVWPADSLSGARLALGILMLTIVPPILSLTPYYRAFFSAGLTGNIWGLTIIYSFYAILLAVLIFRSFLIGFPREIREAALIDGVGEWRALFQCIAPNLQGGIFATFVLALIQSWNEFMYALVLTNAHSATVPVAVAGFLSFFGTNWAQLTAAGVMGALPIVVFAIIVRKQMARGLTFGGIR